jgi:hypothetical protein
MARCGTVSILAGHMEGWFYICSALLVGAGFAKVRDPAPTRGALVAAGLPAAQPIVVGLGMVEIAAGLAGLVVGGVGAGLAVAALYAGFAGFVGWALAKGLPVQSCGCFGRSDTPPSGLHVAANTAAAVGATWFAIAGGAPLLDTLADQPLAGVPYLGFLGIAVLALYLILTELPRVMRLTEQHS